MTIQIGDVIGDYKVIGVAGSGGMGAVYKIEHVITKRIEAMKLLPPGLSSEPEQVQRFEREIQVQARLHHPNIVALYNAVRDGGSMALVMEFVEGESLQRLLEAGPLPMKTAVNYTRQVLSALAYAHEAGVIHRDVAPANIIITLERTVKLTDFGLARAETDLRLTSSGVPVGSPWYMSPEQVRGIGVIDARTDIYAVGAVLHEMLTGRKLFDVDGAFAVMRAQVEAVSRPPSTWTAGIPAALDEIVRRALEKDPAGRFQSAAEFRTALESIFPDSAPLTAPVPAPMAAPVRLAAPTAAPMAAPLPAQLPAPVPISTPYSVPVPAALAVQLAPTVVSAPAPPPPQSRPQGGLRVAMRRWVAGFSGFHPSRAAVALALLPAALLGSYFALRPLTKTGTSHAATRPARETPVKQVEAAPAPLDPTPVLPPADPAVPESAIVGTRPAVSQAAPLDPKTPPSPPKTAQGPARSPRPASKPQPSYALRVTGGEVVPSATMPAAAPAPAPTPSVSDATNARPAAVEPPVTPPPAAATTPAQDATATPQEADPAKPQKGNRFVRAIGKIFHKTKDDPADTSKTPVKKD